MLPCVVFLVAITLNFNNFPIMYKCSCVTLTLKKNSSFHFGSSVFRRQKNERTKSDSTTDKSAL